MSPVCCLLSPLTRHKTLGHSELPWLHVQACPYAQTGVEGGLRSVVPRTNEAHWDAIDRRVPLSVPAVRKDPRTRSFKLAKRCSGARNLRRTANRDLMAEMSDFRSPYARGFQNKRIAQICQFSITHHA